LLELVLYPGNEEEKQIYFKDFFESESIEYFVDSSFLGDYISVNIKRDELHTVSALISVFILEFYLKEYVLTKIYDEYEMIDVSVGCDVLLSLNREISKSEVGKNIEKFLLENKLICIDNYVLFNLKSIMTTVYFLTDCLCEKILYQKCRADFLSFVRSCKELDYESPAMADAEFGGELFWDDDNSEDFNDSFF